MGRAAVRPYLVAIAAGAGALGLTLLLWPEVEPTPSPFFFAAVVFASWYGGLGPALLATACATIATAYLFVPPVHSVAIESASDVIRLGLFALVALLTSSLHQARRRAETERGQHAMLATLGRLALEGSDPRTLFREAATRIALALACERVIVWEAVEDGVLVRRADVSGRGGILEHAPLGDGPDGTLPARTENAADGSATARVVMEGPAGPLGLVAVTPGRRPLDGDDRYFVQAVAHVLAEAVARRRAEQERGRLLAAERTARTRAEAASRARHDVLAIVSHELRAPLQSLLTWSHVIRHGPRDDGSGSRALDAIERSAETLHRLTADLLDESRLTAGKIVLRRRRVLLAEPVLAALELMRIPAEAKHVDLRLSIDPAPLPVIGDAMRLQQIVWNVVGNAVKFTAAGGRIEVGLRRGEETADIVVSDTGPGIAPELLPHVFEPFWQGGEERHAGLGLGLAIVRDLVELHGGSVRVESSGPGRGATFTVSLPLAEDAEETVLRDAGLLLASG